MRSLKANFEMASSLSFIEMPIVVENPAVKIIVKLVFFGDVL